MTSKAFDRAFLGAHTGTDPFLCTRACSPFLQSRGKTTPSPFGLHSVSGLSSPCQQTLNNVSPDHEGKISPQESNHNAIQTPSTWRGTDVSSRIVSYDIMSDLSNMFATPNAIAWQWKTPSEPDTDPVIRKSRASFPTETNDSPNLVSSANLSVADPFKASEKISTKNSENKTSFTERLRTLVPTARKDLSGLPLSCNLVQPSASPANNTRAFYSIHNVSAPSPPQVDLGEEPNPFDDSPTTRLRPNRSKCFTPASAASAGSCSSSSEYESDSDFECSPATSSQASRGRDFFGHPHPKISSFPESSERYSTSPQAHKIGFSRAGCNVHAFKPSSPLPSESKALRSLDQRPKVPLRAPYRKRKMSEDTLPGRKRTCFSPDSAVESGHANARKRLPMAVLESDDTLVMNSDDTVVPAFFPSPFKRQDVRHTTLAPSSPLSVLSSLSTLSDNDQPDDEPWKAVGLRDFPSNVPIRSEYSLWYRRFPVSSFYATRNGRYT
jgi:hypothetical protein